MEYSKAEFDIKQHVVFLCNPLFLVHICNLYMEKYIINMLFGGPAPLWIPAKFDFAKLCGNKSF